MGTWTDAYERLNDALKTGVPIEEVERAAADELEHLLATATAVS